MSKRTLIISGVLTVIVLAGIIWAVLGKNQGQISLLGPTGTTPKTQTTTEKEETYTDTAGFSFKHPESIAVADKTPDDDTYYTLLTLTSKTKSGGPLTITIMDTNFKTLDEWLAKDPSTGSGLGGATLSGATSLSGISAKQYSTSTKFWTVAIDSGILYYIQGPKDGDYWDKVQDLATSSFTTVKPQAAQPAGRSDSGAEDVIFEEEEVIE